MLEEEINQSTKSFIAELSSYQDSVIMDGILKQKTQELIVKVNSQCCSKEDKEEIFSKMWEKEAENILRKIPQELTSETYIRTAVEKAIKDSLGSKDFMYIKKKAENSNTSDQHEFIVKQNHVNEGTKIAPHILHQLKRNTEDIKAMTTVHYRRAEKGKQFEPKHAEALFKDIERQIDQMKDERIETTLHYRVDFMVHIEELAVRNFFVNQKEYEQNRFPTKLLNKKRKAYHEIFLIATDKGDQAVGFSRLVLKLIQENLKDQTTCTGLLNILRNQHGDTFRSAEALTTSSIMTLWSKNRRTIYRVSFAKYREMIMETITKKSVTYFEDEDRLKTHAKSALDAIIAEVIHVIKKTAQSSHESEDFIGTLFSNMNGLRKPHNDIEAYKMLKVNDKNQFTSSLIDQLMGPIHQQLKKDIESWNIARTIERKGLTEFSFKEIVGCLFCQVQRVGTQSFKEGSHNYMYTITFDKYRHGEELKTHNCNEIGCWATEGLFIEIEIRPPMRRRRGISEYENHWIMRLLETEKIY